MSPIRRSRFAGALLAAVLAGCSATGTGRWVKDPAPNREWADLIARSRSPILKDMKEEDSDLLGWHKVVQERQEADRARLAKQPKVTASFVDLTVRDALFELSNQTKVPIVVDQTVSGNVTLDLKEIPLESAVRLIVFAGGYAYSTDGFAYYVGLPDPNSASYSMLTASRVLPTYLPPKALVAGLNKAYSGYVSFVEGANKIVLTGPSVVLDRLEADLRLLDRPPVQVQIECLVVETKYGNDHDLGLEWTAAQLEVQQNLLSDNNRATFNLNNLDVIGQLALTFNVMEQRNLARIRSHPKVVTTNGTPAEIRSLVETYVLITQPGVTLFQTNLEIIKAGTILKVTPVVTRNDEIELTLEPEVSDVVGISNQSTGNLPVISRRATKSTVRLKNNEVLVIGGLYQDGLRDTVRGLPFLKDVPILNLVAGRQDRRESSSELLIFVSPKVLK